MVENPSHIQKQTDGKVSTLSTIRRIGLRGTGPGFTRISSFLEPNHHPENVTLVSTNSTEMFVEWMHIPGKHRNGILRGYRVFYRVNGSVDVWQEQAVRPAARSTLLSGLEKFVWYEVKVAGFTIKGLGPESPAMVQRTQEDGE